MFPRSENVQRRSRALNELPTICRISLGYIQQMAGVPHQSVSQKIASEFSDIHINGAQLRCYHILHLLFLCFL